MGFRTWFLKPIITRLDTMHFVAGSDHHKLMQKVNKMTTALENLRSEVEQIKTASGSALALIQSLSQRLKDAIGNEEALNQLAADLDVAGNDLAAAVAANTTAAEEPGAKNPAGGEAADQGTGTQTQEQVNAAAQSGYTGAEAGQKNVDPNAELNQDGPTVEEYVKAGYKASNYPPEGYASKSTQEEIDAAIAAENKTE